MYSNVFDTVRNNNSDKVSYEGFLYASILSGLHPTLSLTQAFDSDSLIKIVSNDVKNTAGNNWTNTNKSSFLELIKSGRIKVSLYGSLQGGGPRMTEYLSGKLQSCQDDPSAFRFSSLPFLERNYADRLPVVFRTMDYCLSTNHSFFSSTKQFDEGVFRDWKDEEKESVSNFLNSAKAIEQAIDGRYSPASKARLSLSLLFLHHSRQYIQESDGIKEEYIESMKELRERYIYDMQNDPSWKDKKDIRSYLYDLRDACKCSAEANEELTALIDVCYNEAVASSIEDNEDDIIVCKDGSTFSGVYSSVISRNDSLDQSSVKAGLVSSSIPASDTLRNMMTWERLNDILKNAAPRTDSPEHWAEDINRYYSNLDVEWLKLQSKKIPAIGLVFASSIVSILPENTPAFIKFGLSFAFGIAALFPDVNASKDRLAEIASQKKLIDAFSCDTAVLKRDLNKRDC